MKGNKCFMFPAFILKLATVFLILEFHTVPETQNNFLLVISSAQLLSTHISPTSKLLWGHETPFLSFPHLLLHVEDDFKLSATTLWVKFVLDQEID